MIRRILRLGRSDPPPPATPPPAPPEDADIERMRHVRRSLVSVVNARRRLELNLAQLRDIADRELAQAEAAVAAGDEEVARAYLERRHEAIIEAEELEASIERLVADEHDLERAESRLNARIRLTRARGHVSEARLLAARTNASVNEALAGLAAPERHAAEQAEATAREVETLNSRSRALEDLVDEAVLDDPRRPRRASEGAGDARDRRDIDVEMLLSELRAGEPRPRLVEAPVTPQENPPMTGGPP
jgi:phage shock protein A